MNDSGRGGGGEREMHVVWREVAMVRGERKNGVCLE